MLSFMAITVILLLIALSNRFAVFLAKAATGELPVGLVFRLVLLYIPELLSFLIPLGLFIAILFTFGRLHADSEMTVLAACGLSWGFISKLTFYISLSVMVVTALLSLWLVPQITLYREKVLSEGEALAVMQSLLPGRFQMFNEGNMVFYIEDMKSKDKTLKGIFIAEQPSAHSKKEENGWALITAKEARLERDQDSKNFYTILNEGYRYQGKPGLGNYTVMQFEEYGRTAEPTSGQVPETQKLKSTKALLHSGILEDAAEFQWRLSIPISVFILAFLAIPLARVNPRHGRFAKFLPAIVLYIVYYNLFTLCKRWVASGTLMPGIGVWWVHGLFLMLALFLLSKESGFLKATLRRWS